MKRVLFFGSRNWLVRELVQMEMYDLKEAIGDYIVIHGACPTGVDHYASMYARDFGLEQMPYPAEWADYGKSAGSIRNTAMIRSGVGLALGYIFNGSKGSEDMLSKLEFHKVPYKVTRLETYRTWDFPKGI